MWTHRSISDIVALVATPAPQGSFVALVAVSPHVPPRRLLFALVAVWTTRHTPSTVVHVASPVHLVSAARVAFVHVPKDGTNVAAANACLLIATPNTVGAVATAVATPSFVAAANVCPTASRLKSCVPGAVSSYRVSSSTVVPVAKHAPPWSNVTTDAVNPLVPVARSPVVAHVPIQRAHMPTVADVIEAVRSHRVAAKEAARRAP